jgi:hypothetical protein
MRASTVIIGGIFVLAAAGGTGAANHAAAHAVTTATRHTNAPVTGPGETAYLTAVLRDLGAPATSANLTSLAAWVRSENSTAENNPLDTTLTEPGATWFNNIPLADGQVIHVMNYPAATVGAAATAATISGGYYPHIDGDLTAGTGVCNDPATASEFLEYSGNGYSRPDCP